MYMCVMFTLCALVDYVRKHLHVCPLQMVHSHPGEVRQTPGALRPVRSAESLVPVMEVRDDVQAMVTPLSTRQWAGSRAVQQAEAEVSIKSFVA